MRCGDGCGCGIEDGVLGVWGTGWVLELRGGEEGGGHWVGNGHQFCATLTMYGVDWCAG